MDFDAFLKNPSENLKTELKDWFDPNTLEGKAKIVKAAIAFRNNNGGNLIIGISDNGKITSNPNPESLDKDFHQDQIQFLITKHSSEAFEVKVTIVEHLDARIPFITIPPGVRTPVAVKLGIKDHEKNKDIIKIDSVYTRTLESNGTPSTALASVKDWPKIMENCFNNREADIGSFVRRHLIGIDIHKVISDLSTPLITPQESSEQFLDDCYQRFINRPTTPEWRDLGVGLFECSFIIESSNTAIFRAADTKFLNAFLAANPSHSGWPFWMDTRGISAPKTKDEGWEALIEDYHGGAFPPHVDFWRAEPSGRFYHIRHLWEDTHAIISKREPNTGLAFDLAIQDITEVISTGISIAKSIGYQDDQTTINFTFRWSGLSDRFLITANKRRHMPFAYVCHDESLTEHVSLPLDISPSAIVDLTPKIVARLFSLFDGKIFDDEIIKEIAQKLLNDRH